MMTNYEKINKILLDLPCGFGVGLRPPCRGPGPDDMTEPRWYAHLYRGARIVKNKRHEFGGSTPNEAIENLIKELEGNSICWEEEIEPAPESIYEMMTYKIPEEADNADTG